MDQSWHGFSSKFNFDLRILIFHFGPIVSQIILHSVFSFLIPSSSLELMALVSGSWRICLSITFEGNTFEDCSVNLWAEVSTCALLWLYLIKWIVYSDALKFKMSAQKDADKFFMSIREGEKKPFDALRVLYGKYCHSSWRLCRYIDENLLTSVFKWLA